MKTIKKKLAVLMFILCSFLLLPMQSPKAALLPTASDNRTVSLRRKSNLVNVNNGYMRVYYNGKSIEIEYYDNHFKITSKKTIAMELPVWGGFYAGSDGFYVVEGKNNTAEDDRAEIIRVIKYDTAWRRKGAASITGNKELFGGEVRYPFDYGCVEFAEQGNKLYIVTAHEGYVDSSVGQGHQGFLMIEVDKSSMKGKIIDSDLWHSFAQYIKSKDTYLYVLEQSEGSRYTKLSRYDTRTMEKTSIPVLKYGGSRDSAWSIACYASVDGMALSKDHILCLGTSIDQSKYDTAGSDGAAHNIYLTVTPMSNFSETATEVKWLTDYVGNRKSFLGAKITKVSENRFMISWEEYNTSGKGEDNDGLSEGVLHYLYVDGKGNKISKEYTAAATISDCQPIVKDSKVIYYASNTNTVNFYSIDSSNGVLSKNTYRALGKNATWNFANGVLTISGTGKIELGEVPFRGPVSSTGGMFTHDQSKWPKSILNKTKKIVIKSGITGIEKEAFAHFTNLEEVNIESGLQSIEEKAFYSCEKLRKIAIPSSVTKIGKDILWTGYTWVGSGDHVVYAVIYSTPGSYAIKYAKQNSISYGMDFSKASVSGIKSSYRYTGKTIKPSVTVKLGGQVLKKDRDYQVSYRNNKKVGTATITITGKGIYRGEIKKTFKIVKTTASSKKSMKTCSVSQISTQRYTGKSVKPSITVKDGSKKLKSGTHYTVTYKNNRKVGKATVVITGKGNYTGSITKNFAIKYMTPGKGKMVKVSGAYYKITRSGSSKTAEVQYVRPVNKKKSKVSIPATIKTGNVTCKVTSIAANAFKDNRYIKAVSIGKYVTSIGEKAFFNCSKLSRVTFSDKLEKIGVKSFAKCKALKSITLPARVTVIGNHAFYGCGNLKLIEIKSCRLSSKTVETNAFGKIYGKAKVKVPAKKRNFYAQMLPTKGMGENVVFVSD
ncbi:MAG: leucine-rich repeat protein [Marvinbryantia sp.]|jgi:hypothetical protein